MKDKIVALYFTVSLMAISGVVGLLVFWTFQPYELPTVQEPIRVLNTPRVPRDELPIEVDIDQESFPVIRQGEPFIMELEVNKPQEIAPVATRFFECISGNLVTLTSGSVDLPVGEYTVTTASDFSDPQRPPIVTPNKFTVHDICRFGFDLTYDVNPLTKPEVSWRSEWGIVKE